MRKIYTKPGVFIGLSVDRPFKGKVIDVYADGQKKYEIDLEYPFPTEHDKHAGTLPGFEPEEQLFFEEKLTIEYPNEVEKNLEIFVS